MDTFFMGSKANLQQLQQGFLLGASGHFQFQGKTSYAFEE
jgi:hypothetical protein